MLFEKAEKKVDLNKRPTIRSRVSYKQMGAFSRDMPPLPKRSMSRPWGLQRAVSEGESIRSKASETGSVRSKRPESTRSSIIKSSTRERVPSPSVKTPEVEVGEEASMTAASSVAEFAKVKEEAADLLRTSSGDSPIKQVPQRRKPVKRPAAAQITTELKDKDEESQAKFRTSSFITNSKSAPNFRAQIMTHYPGVHKAPSIKSQDQGRTSLEKFDAILEAPNVPIQGSPPSESDKHGDDDASPKFKVSEYSSPELKYIEVEQDLNTIVQADGFDAVDAEVVFLSSRVNKNNDRQPVTRFRVHATNLAVHSPLLVELCEMVRSSNNEAVEIPLQQDADTLKLLFSLMYNRAAVSLGPGDWQKVMKLAWCAQKFDVARAKDTSIAYFIDQERRATISPFITYSFAMQHNLPDLEMASAERSASFDINGLPEATFKIMGFSGFQKLAAYHSSRQAYYSDVLNSIVIDPRDLAEQCYQSNGNCVILPWNNLKQKLAWSKADRKQTGDRKLRPDYVMAQLVSEIGEIDCGTCCRALVQAALQAKRALEMTPMYEV